MQKSQTSSVWLFQWNNGNEINGKQALSGFDVNKNKVSSSIDYVFRKHMYKMAKK